MHASIGIEKSKPFAPDEKVKTAPVGLESNWIPTESEDFFLLFRFYGPEEAY